jgi:hypothetical protein
MNISKTKICVHTSILPIYFMELMEYLIEDKSYVISHSESFFKENSHLQLVAPTLYFACIIILFSFHTLHMPLVIFFSLEVV